MRSWQVALWTVKSIMKCHFTTETITPWFLLFADDQLIPEVVDGIPHETKDIARDNRAMCHGGQVKTVLSPHPIMPEQRPIQGI